MIERYMTVESYSRDHLDNKVNTLIEKGWQLQGGVSVTCLPNASFYYCQAVVMESN